MKTFWSENLSILFQKNKLSEFFPVKNMSLDDKLNTIVRLSIYISIVLYFKSHNYKVFFILISSLFLTYLIYRTKKKIIESESVEKLENFIKDKKKIGPTINNPFTNILFDEYESGPNRESLIDIESEKSKKELEEKFGYNLYKDINDIYNTNNSQRQFYTTPITTIPNKQKEFAEWLYKTKPTCKEGNGFQCIGNNYTPLNGNSRLPMI